MIVLNLKFYSAVIMINAVSDKLVGSQKMPNIDTAY